MKHKIPRLLLVATVLLLCLGLVFLSGCGKDDKDNGTPTGPNNGNTINTDLLGTWESTELNVLNGILVLTPEDSMFIHITVTLKSDNTLDYVRTEADSTTQGTGTWSATDSEATISLSEDMNISGTYTLNDAKDILIVNATVSFDMTSDGVDNPVMIPVKVTFMKKEN